MPKRIVDGEGLWRSDKLAEVQPSSFKAEYANMLPLALANGSFEANPRRIWSAVYSYNRPEVTLEHVEQILAEFERVKLLFRWADPATGKQWGYFVGIEKPGRLPPPSRLRQGHEILGPNPSHDALQAFLLDVVTSGQPVASQSVPNGSIGFGFCSGLGLGKGNGSPMANQENTDPTPFRERSAGFNSTEVARALCSEKGWSGHGMIWALRAAIDFQARRVPEATLEQIGEGLAKSYILHKSAQGKFAVGPQKFFEQGLYQDSVAAIVLPDNILTNNPATRALAQMEAE